MEKRKCWKQICFWGWWHGTRTHIHLYLQLNLLEDPLSGGRSGAVVGSSPPTCPLLLSALQPRACAGRCCAITVLTMAPQPVPGDALGASDPDQNWRRGGMAGGPSLLPPDDPPLTPHPKPCAHELCFSAETIGPMAVWKPLWFLTQTKALHLPYLHHTQEELIGNNALHTPQWPGMSEMPCPAPCQLVAPEWSGGSQCSPHNFYGGSLMLSIYLNPTLNFFSA